MEAKGFHCYFASPPNSLPNNQPASKGWLVFHCNHQTSIPASVSESRPPKHTHLIKIAHTEGIKAASILICCFRYPANILRLYRKMLSYGFFVATPIGFFISHASASSETVSGPIEFLWPIQRPWYAAWQTNNPCGTNDQAPGNRTDFPLGEH